MKNTLIVSCILLSFSCKDNPSIHSSEYRELNQSFSKMTKVKDSDQEPACGVTEGLWNITLSDELMTVNIEKSPNDNHASQVPDLAYMMKELSLETLKWHALHEDKTKLDGIWQADLTEASYPRENVFKRKWTIQSMRLNFSKKEHQLSWGVLFLNPFTKKHTWCLVNAEVDIESVKDHPDQFKLEVLEHAEGRMKNGEDSRGKEKEHEVHQH